MDKRRNHIIFWVGYYLYSVITNYAITSGFRTFFFTITMTFVTIFFSILVFYFFTEYIFPVTIYLKKYYLLAIIILFVSVLSSVMYHYTIFAISKIQPNIVNNIYINRTVPYFLSRYFSIIYITLVYWYLSVYKKNLINVRVIELQNLILLKSKNQAELLSLINQINPHFLYNILNFFYAQSLSFSEKLSNEILTLSDMMRYSIREKDDQGMVALEKEIKYIKGYVNLENIENTITLSIDGKLTYRRIKPLILLPLIEIICDNRIRENKDIIFLKIEKNELSLSVKYSKKNIFEEKNVKIHIEKYKQLLIKEYHLDYTLFFEQTPSFHTIQLKLIL